MMIFILKKPTIWQKFMVIVMFTGTENYQQLLQWIQDGYLLNMADKSH